MALVVGSSGGRGGVRLIFSGLLQRLLGLRSHRPRTGTPSGSNSSDEDDESSPLVGCIPRDVFPGSSSRSPHVRDSSSARMFGAMHKPFGHLDSPARKLFDVGTVRPQSAKRGLEMTTGTRHVTGLAREHVMPPVVVVNTAPGQPPMLQVPLTDGAIASFLAQGLGVRIDGTDGVTTTGDRARIPDSSDSKGGPTQWMKVFRALLLAHVFFALPLIVIFFPRYDNGTKKDLLLSLFDRKEEGAEKLIVLFLFVVHASLGSMGVLLAHIADGPACMGIVGSLTVCIIISVVGFIDYIFWKTLPPENIYNIFFLGHFIVMLLVICLLWGKFVGFSPCCCSKLDSRRRPPV